jgi:hypothetical protein
MSTDSTGSLSTASRTKTWTVTSDGDPVVVVVVGGAVVEDELEGVVDSGVAVSADDVLGCVVVVVGSVVFVEVKFDVVVGKSVVVGVVVSVDDKFEVVGGGVGEFVVVRAVVSVKY